MIFSKIAVLHSLFVFDSQSLTYSMLPLLEIYSYVFFSRYEIIYPYVAYKSQSKVSCQVTYLQEIQYTRVARKSRKIL